METLSNEQIEKFINNGFIKVENAFTKKTAEECRTILWEATSCDPNNPETWTEPVIRIGELAMEPFIQAANTEILHSAYDQLLGSGNWIAKESLGSFPIRFPSKEKANDTGWHVDASFPGANIHDYFEWRININSRGRGLLMLFLFSDVSERDAPTIIKVGSHHDVAKTLEPEGDNGLSFMELAHRLYDISQSKEIIATGKAGSVYLCHPLIVHAAQDHEGTEPKFMAQPPLLLKNEFDINKPFEELCPVEKAIKLALVLQ